MFAQLAGCLRGGTIGKVGRGSHDCHPDVRANPDRNHVLLHLFAHADTGVEALCDNVGETFIDMDLNRDVGIILQQFRQYGPQDSLGGMPERGDADRACRLVAKRRERSNFTVDMVECRAQADKQPFACLGQRQAARRSRDQPHTDPLFEHAHRIAERGLGEAKLRSRACKTPLLGNRDKHSPFAEVASSHLSTSFLYT